MSKLKPNFKVVGKYFPTKHILKFENKLELISDEDILNLFLGLVRLIKRSTELKVEQKFLHEIETLKKQLHIKDF